MNPNRSVQVDRFAMVPRPEVPRSRFDIEHTLKTGFDVGLLVPIYLEEVLPGDQVSANMTVFARMSTPLVPVMDNLYCDTFFFFVPNRLVWSNWRKFMGEQANPSDSISFTVPQCVSPAGGWPVQSIGDYYGLPSVGQVGAGNTVSASALPLRGYNLIFNEWFRDQNLINSVNVPVNDGPDANTNYTLLRRGKRHDYFTSALPWPQKGGTSVSLPLGTSAPVRGLYTATTGSTVAVTGQDIGMGTVGTVSISPTTNYLYAGSKSAAGTVSTTAFNAANANVYADLTAATAATINQLRQAFQIQKLLERDARGGTRYTEIVRAHFGVQSPDARLQRPEFLGGGSTPVVINPVTQSVDATTIAGSGTISPLGQQGAFATMVSNRHRFDGTFTEHGYIHGFAMIRADLTYQQGLRRHWRRSTRYDYYFPVFAALGEQAIESREIFCDGSVADANIFGYQERWAEYRYSPSMITGRMRSTAASTLDVWHLAQRFATRPVLNQSFIEENPPITRVLAVQAATTPHMIFDALFTCRWTRPLPMYSVPGLIDHF